MSDAVLTPGEVAARIQGLAGGWTSDSDQLVRIVEFPAFRTAVDFIVAMADVAERLDHHPDVRLSWRTVELTLSTHSAGGVTEADFELARELDAVVTRLAP